jgi:hypothetical protein
VEGVLQLRSPAKEKVIRDEWSASYEKVKVEIRF